MWAAVLLLVAGVAFVVVHLRGPETPDGNDPAEATATAVSAMLDESVAGRANLLRAIDEIMSCRTGKTTRQGIQNAVKARQALLKKVGDFDASSLPTGAKIKTGLQEALTRSLEADQAYLKWYDAAKGRCPKQSGTLFKAVQKANARSRAAKNAFLEDWNPVAQQYNLPERDAGSI